MTDAEKIEGEAANWVVRLHSDQRTEADRDAFRDWLDADPAHVEAFSAHAAIWDSVAAWGDNREAREVLRFQPMWSGFGRRVIQWSIAGAGLAVAAALVVFVFGGLRLTQRYETVPGELRTISLSDGSILLMNTDSRISTRFTAGERRVVVEQGQAYFRVAKDKSRPFRVFVGRDEVRAVGTAFDVRRLGDHAEVVLEEGRLAIYRDVSSAEPLLARRKAGPAPRPALYMNAGQALDLPNKAPPIVQVANVPQSSAWRYGRVVLDDTRLEDAAADLNRYGGPQIVLSDPRLADIRISGVFHTGRPYDVVSDVVGAFPIKVVKDDGKQIVLGMASPDPRADTPAVVKNSR
ncbi:FecR domain-containing protein [Caulobacter sp. X]|uniref:FecR family protein n=1 Tax=Caulobacter sp. X TaxID=2048901 RepID=UPI000C148FA8|nr:FecR domain-containing protein [Caulobacter sp. X]PIC00544.1 iron dicitrate transport regulator FecR [Caulobacter sp. X]